MYKESGKNTLNENPDAADGFSDLSITSSESEEIEKQNQITLAQQSTLFKQDGISYTTVDINNVLLKGMLANPNYTYQSLIDQNNTRLFAGLIFKNNKSNQRIAVFSVTQDFNELDKENNTSFQSMNGLAINTTLKNYQKMIAADETKKCRFLAIPVITANNFSSPLNLYNKKRNHYVSLFIDTEENIAYLNDSSGFLGRFYPLDHIKNAVTSNFKDIQFKKNYTGKQKIYNTTDCGGYVTETLFGSIIAEKNVACQESPISEITRIKHKLIAKIAPEVSFVPAINNEIAIESMEGNQPDKVAQKFSIQPISKERYNKFIDTFDSLDENDKQLQSASTNLKKEFNKVFQITSSNDEGANNASDNIKFSITACEAKQLLDAIDTFEKSTRKILGAWKKFGIALGMIISVATGLVIGAAIGATLGALITGLAAGSVSAGFLAIPGAVAGGTLVGIKGAVIGAGIGAAVGAAITGGSATGYSKFKFFAEDKAAKKLASEARQFIKNTPRA